MRMSTHAKFPRRKRATNVTIDADLLTRARALGLNVSSAVEDGLRARIREEEIRRWHEDSKDAIEALNKETREHGLWTDRWRRF